MKRVVSVTLLFFSFTALAQEISRPKLVVGIVVDQMRPDYMYRFYSRFGGGGFKRFINEGFVCEQAFIPYTPTYTAPGHASIYTGSVPALNGIVGNSWYSRQLNRFIYCTEDSTVFTVGSTSAAGKMSPRNLWSTTIGDELRLHSNFKNKSISISLKDRGSIIPGGHAANAAYWFDNASGGFISSTYYMQALPRWMEAFNARKLPEAYLEKNWNTLYPIKTYTKSTSDSVAYESNLPHEDNSFPHLTDKIQTGKYESFTYTPYAMSYTVEAVKALIEGERLGSTDLTDMLAISFSSTDYAGHAFGPNSIEVEDFYLRLDKDLANLLAYLDVKIGKGMYTAFLTADHGVASVAKFAVANKLPGGVVNQAQWKNALEERLKEQFGGGAYIQSISNYQVFLNEKSIADAKADRIAVVNTVIGFLLQQPAVVRAIDLQNLTGSNFPEYVKSMLVNGYNQKLSGDIQYLLKPGWFEGGEKGTTHGSWNPYDAQVPLLWFGWGIKKGRLQRQVYMNDIAPTVSALLHIPPPNAATGNVITEVVK